MYWFNRQRTALLASMKTAPSVEPYLTFQSVNSFTISVASPKWNGIMEYSTNTISWFTWDGSVISSLGGKIYLRGTGNTRVSHDGNNKSEFIISGTAVECVGNIETLLDWQTVLNGEHPIMDTYCFTWAFGNNYALISAPELPSHNLNDFCYSAMFYNCDNLTIPPALPATILKDFCYQSMFYDCDNLTTVPALPATVLAYNCYEYMFLSCDKIKVSATKTGIYQYEWRIPTSGTISSTKSNWNNEMLYGTGGTFKYNPQINTTYYVENQPVSS
jgi:hypothetical protein